MIFDAPKYFISQIFYNNNNFIFKIPKYQREYVWGMHEWEALFDDLCDNDKGSFLGSIICILSSMHLTNGAEYEVVDGQQRLTTLSILFCACYKILNDRVKLLNEKQRYMLFQLGQGLVPEDEVVRILPQIQNSNQEDYKALLSELGLFSKRSLPKNAGNRRIYKAYKYFCDRFEKVEGSEEDRIAFVLKMLDKINSAIIVMITVTSHSDAYKLFETLNNRGLPLTSVDLIKNLLLSRLEDNTYGNSSKIFDRWLDILNNLGDDYTNQERFFRHNYNAFRKSINEAFSRENRQYALGSIATRSNLINIYENMIDENPQKAFDLILENSFIYAQLLLHDTEGLSPEQKVCYLNLQRVQGASSYLLLLYLLKMQNKLKLELTEIIKICNLLVSFFIRRNLTDTPPTRDLDRMFMKFIEDIEKGQYQQNKIYDNLRDVLIDCSATSEIFEEKLRGQIYDSNVGATRFILCRLAEQKMTKENKQNLWERNNSNKYIWTIEHIFPKGENIPQHWVDMIADGDYEKAKKYQDEYVHTLGNLTITCYNSSLSNKPFDVKKECKDDNGNYIGFRNGLSLNEDVASENEWTVDKIKNRTNKMVKDILELFKF